MCTLLPTPLNLCAPGGGPELELSPRECVRSLKLDMPAPLVSHGSHRFRTRTRTRTDEGKCVCVHFGDSGHTAYSQTRRACRGRVSPRAHRQRTGLAVTDARTSIRLLSSRHSAPWRSSPGRCGPPGSHVRHHPPHASTRTCSHPLTPAHTRSQMFRYRCVTAGEIPARKNPLSPSETQGCRGFSVAVPVGFEPTVESPPHNFSRVAPSAARTRYRGRV